MSLPTFQPSTALPAGAGEFIAPVTITSAQAAGAPFQINLGSIPTTFTAFQAIQGVTIDNTANGAAGVSFVVSAVGTNQTWNINPGDWRIIRVSGGNVTSLTITPISWTSGSVTFTLWNTAPPQETSQLGTVGLTGDVTIAGPLTIETMGNVDLGNAFLIQQQQQLTGIGGANSNNLNTGLLQSIPLAPPPAAGNTRILQNMTISMTGLVVAAAGVSCFFGIHDTAGNSVCSLFFTCGGVAVNTPWQELFSETGLAIPAPGGAGIGFNGVISAPTAGAFNNGYINFFIGYYDI